MFMVKISIPPEDRIRFFVYIIESPSAPDLYHKRYEGEVLQKALSLDSIQSVHRIAVNAEAFSAAFTVGVEEAIKYYVDLIPIIHISAHGSLKGIGLSDGSVVEWKVLRDLLKPIYTALKGALILCVSSCNGAAACEMAMSENEEQPFFALVGNSSRPTWSDTAVAYSAFYHLIKKGCYITDAVDAMREASGDDNFKVFRGEEVKKTYLDIIRNEDFSKIKNELELEMKKHPVSPEANRLEKS
jgi:hypothetical protein